MSHPIRILIIAASATLAIPACTGLDHVGIAVAAGGPDYYDGYRTASAGFNHVRGTGMARAH